MTTLILAALACSPQTAPTKTGGAPIGINLAGPADWNSELPFVDAFKLSREWISQREGAGWGQGPKIALDARGYPKAIEPGCFAETLMFTDMGAHYPGGDYTITYKGRGRIGFNGPVTVRSEAPGKIRALVDNTKAYGIYLRVLETDPADPVRDIHVWMPGFSDGKAAFHPAFLNRWKGVTAFRFMDWMMTNGSTQSAWADRPKPEDATWTTKGIPVEVMVRLCNEQDADGWFTMPHRATDEYVSKFAAYVAANLKPERKAYVEWSNEVWNAQFEQHRYAAEQGSKANLGPDQYHNAWRYTARRSVQIFNLWTEAFKGRKGLMRVLAGQAGWTEPAKQILAFENAGKRADMLSIAPYFGLSVGPQSTPTSGEVTGWNVERVLDHLDATSIRESASYVKGHVALAKQYGLKLSAYEAGQHAVGIQGAENDDRLTSLLQGANRHPRMDALHRRYLDAVSPTNGGGIDGPIMMFSSVGGYSKWGSWGAAEWYDQPRTPKLDGIRGWASGRGQKIGVK